MQKKIEKKFLVFEIIASEMVAVNCLYYVEILVTASQYLKKQF